MDNNIYPAEAVKAIIRAVINNEMQLEQAVQAIVKLTK